MLLTRRSTPTAAPAAGVASSSLVSSLARGLQRAIPTLDRRSFLRRSGLGVGGLWQYRGSDGEGKREQQGG